MQILNNLLAHLLHILSFRACLISFSPMGLINTLTNKRTPHMKSKDLCSKSKLFIIATWFNSSIVHI